MKVLSKKCKISNVLTLLQYVPSAGDAVLGIVVDSKADVNHFIYLLVLVKQCDTVFGIDTFLDLCWRSICVYYKFAK